MKEMRRKEKQIPSKDEIIEILKKTKYITIAMCENNNPYLITLTHGYDPKQNVIYFHCAKKGKKIEILRKNNLVWGQALIDNGYIHGKCDHLYTTAHFSGKVTFINDRAEKKHALETMIQHQEPVPEQVIQQQITEKSVKNVHIGRIDISYLSGKKSDEVIES